MLRIGITGGIGSGKTTVCQIFEKIGIPVYYADPRARELMYRNKELKLKLKSILGSNSYHKNGRPNRPYIANKIFNNQELLHRVNSLVHPAVHADANQWMKMHKSHPYILYEAALLVENGSFKNMDRNIVVTAPEKLRIQRVMKRDKLSEDDVIERLKNQLPEEQKIKIADFIIVNDGNKTLIPQIINIHNKILKEPKRDA